jgi:hypothetical protein
MHGLTGPRSLTSEERLRGAAAHKNQAPSTPLCCGSSRPGTSARTGATSENNRRARYYGLTAAGRRRLAREARGLGADVRPPSTRLLLGPARGMMGTMRRTDLRAPARFFFGPRPPPRRWLDEELPLYHLAELNCASTRAPASTTRRSGAPGGAPAHLETTKGRSGGERAQLPPPGGWPPPRSSRSWQEPAPRRARAPAADSRLHLGGRAHASALAASLRVTVVYQPDSRACCCAPLALSLPEPDAPGAVFETSARFARLARLAAQLRRTNGRARQGVSPKNISAPGRASTSSGPRARSRCGCRAPAR